MNSTSHQDNKSSSIKKLKVLALVTSITAFSLISLGGIVRVTESGLACPDWPLCHGKIIPSFELSVIIEYSHRLLALILSCLVVAVTIYVFRLPSSGHNGSLRKMILASWVLLGIQILLGGMTVLTKLRPEFIALHLATAQAFFGVLLLLTCKVFMQDSEKSSPVTLWLADRRLLVTLILIFLTIVSGSLVTNTGAFAACTGWPLCNGQLFPTNHLAGIHWLHRLVVLITILSVFWLFISSRKQRLESPRQILITLLAIVMIVQILVGAATIWLHFTPFWTAIHVTVSALVWGTAVINFGLVVFSPSNQEHLKGSV